MSDSEKCKCKDPEGQWLHICNLREQGKTKEIAELMIDPGHTCLNCNAVTKHAENLCNPSPFLKV